jgi:FeS assembly SUF system protein
LAVIREDVIGILRTVFDPEIPVNVYELGLVYDIDVTPPGDVHVRMTLTSPACPVAGSLPPEVEYKVGTVPGVTAAKVELVWDPPWSPSKMSEAARLQLNI